MTHFGDATFDAMRDVIPFRAHSTAPFGSPNMTRSCCSNIALLLLWPLPIHHTVTLSKDILVPLDSNALQNAMDALGYAKSSWLTKNPLLDLWLQAARQDPDTFVPI